MLSYTIMQAVGKTTTPAPPVPVQKPNHEYSLKDTRKIVSIN